jgi:hypothetical protein
MPRMLLILSDSGSVMAPDVSRLTVSLVPILSGLCRALPFPCFAFAPLVPACPWNGPR